MSVHPQFLVLIIRLKRKNIGVCVCMFSPQGQVADLIWHALNDLNVLSD